MTNWYSNGWQMGDLKIPMPVIQGGMGIGISLAGLAAAVANEGGVGVISAAGIGMLKMDFQKHDMHSDVEALIEEIRRARSMTRGILGVNIMVALSNFGDMVKCSVEEKVQIIFSGAGLPLNLPGFLKKDSVTKLVPIVSSARAAGMIAKWWREKYQYAPDAFVVEGPMAGGHLGFKKEQIDDPDFRLEKLIADVLQEVRGIEQASGKSIPVIAAGGIYTGGDIRRILGLGAACAQMATRFVATEECDADISFKEAYVNCKKEDIGIIESPVGLPGRAIINRFLEKVKSGEKKPTVCPYHCITTCTRDSSPYCICAALASACKGRFGSGFAFVGANGYLVDKIVTVKKLFESLAEEYEVKTLKAIPV